MFGSGSVKPPKPPPPPELPPALVDPVVQRAAMFARVGGKAGFAGTRVAGRWKGRGLAFRVLRPGQTGFNPKGTSLVAGATTGGTSSPSTGGVAAPPTSRGGASTAGGRTSVVIKPPGRGVSYSTARGKRIPTGAGR